MNDFNTPGNLTIKLKRPGLWIVARRAADAALTLYTVERGQDQDTFERYFRVTPASGTRPRYFPQIDSALEYCSLAAPRRRRAAR